MTNVGAPLVPLGTRVRARDGSAEGVVVGYGQVHTSVIPTVDGAAVWGMHLVNTTDGLLPVIIAWHRSYMEVIG